MNRPEGISPEVWEKAEQVAKEATRDAMCDPLMPYYITVAPHIAAAIQSSVEAERAAERERCARVAETMQEEAAAEHEAHPEDGPFTMRGMVLAAKYIAQEIRKGA